VEASDVLVRGRETLYHFPGIVVAAIFDEQDLETVCMPRQNGAKAGMELGKAPGRAIDGDYDGNFGH
jgi:hypothetical protein